MNDPVLVTLTLLLSGIFLAGMLYFDVETSGGAQWDLVKWHYPAIEDFRTKSTLDAIATQRAAGGPLYYIVLSNFDFSQQALRIVSALLLIVSALVFSLAAHGFYGRVAARHDARSRFAEIHLWMTRSGLLACCYTPVKSMCCKGKDERRHDQQKGRNDPKCLLREVKV
ncbi:MAG: hypothetical protein AAGB15_14770 [Pseudomonadota bacterium]